MKLLIMLLALMFFSSCEIGCVTSSHGRSPSLDLQPDCLKYADRSSPGQFIGFGQGVTNDLAVDAASFDLSKQIRASISSDIQLRESNIGTEFDIKNSSKVSEILLGMQVVKRCRVDGGYQAVVVLSKMMFVINLEKATQILLAKASHLEHEIKSTEHVAAVISGEKFLKDHHDEIVNNYNLCKMLNGCGALTLAALDKLVDMVREHMSDIKFVYQPLDSESNLLGGKISALLGMEGFITIPYTDHSGDNLAKTTCIVTHYPTMAGTHDQISDVTCHVYLYSGEHRIDSLAFEGKGIGTSQTEAWEGARRDIRKAD